MKNEKGITLIALVITIIVMLILVAVTINMAINGGLFKKANDASKQMQIEADREELQAAVLDTINDNGDLRLDQVYGNLADHTKWAWDEGNKFTATHNNGDRNEFIVRINRNGGFSVTYVEPSNSGDNITPVAEVPEDLIKYILGESGTGRNADDIMTEDMEFQDDELLTPYINEETAVSVANYIEYDESTIYMYIRYNDDGNIYKIKSIYSEEDESPSFVPLNNLEPIKVITTQDVNVGKTATIDGKKYIVLYGAGEQGANVQLITANTYEVDNVYLGYGDEEIDWTDSSVIAAANISGMEQTDSEGLSNMEKSIYSYNNAITTLNAKCAEVIGNTNSDILDVRCVGSNPTNKNSENSTPYTSTGLQNNPQNDWLYKAGAFNGKGKGGDDNFFDDFERLILIDEAESKNEGNYWLASRYLSEYDRDDDFYVYFGMWSYSYGEFYWYDLFDAQKSHGVQYYKNFGVRPVITISPYVLEDYLD